MLLGIGNSSSSTAIFIAFVGVYFLLTLSTVAAVGSVDPRLIKTARIYGASERQVWQWVIFPAVLPQVFIMLRINFFAAWMAVLAAERVGLKNGVGMMVILGREMFNGNPNAVMVFQEHPLFPWLNVEDNVAFGLKMKGVAPAERRRRAGEVLERVRLTKFASHFPHQLSGGMKQRVAIAQAGACPDCSPSPVAAIQLPGFELPPGTSTDLSLLLRGKLSCGFLIGEDGYASFLRLEQAHFFEGTPS